MICPRCRETELDTRSRSCAGCGFTLPDPDAVPEPLTGALERSIRKELDREFRIQELLGRGGTSLVYLARERDLTRPVAVKVLPLQLSYGNDMIDRFQREAKIAASLDHPNIVPVFRIGTTSTFLWYTMKYVKGYTLADVIEHNGRLEPDQVLQVMEQVSSALHYAHRRGIVHRDIKPGNIMIDENGWVLVCDFGVAKAFGAVPLTVTGGMMGTPAYMAPEQCYGQRLDGRADQYALAVVAYECLAGRPPFVAESIGEYVRLHCSEAPPLLADLVPGLPGTVSEAIHRALSKSPGDRFNDVVDFVEAMGGSVRRRGIVVPVKATPSPDGLQTATPETPHPFVTRPSARKWRRRVKRMGGVAAVGAAVVTAVIFWPQGPGLPAVRGDTVGLQPAPPVVVGPPTLEGGPMEGATADSAAAEAEAAPGRLFITTQPLGDLFIDGRFVGESFTPHGIAIPPGSHVIRVEVPGFRPYEERIDVIPTQEIRRTGIELQPIPQ